jgi:hypothetical protein
MPIVQIMKTAGYKPLCLFCCPFRHFCEHPTWLIPQAPLQDTMACTWHIPHKTSIIWGLKSSENTTKRGKTWNTETLSSLYRSNPKHTPMYIISTQCLSCLQQVSRTQLCTETKLYIPIGQKRCRRHPGNCKLQDPSQMGCLHYLDRLLLWSLEECCQYSLVLIDNPTNNKSLLSITMFKPAAAAAGIQNI